MIQRHGPIVLLAAVLVILAFAFQGSRGLFSPSEGFYVMIAQAMADSGDYMVPHLAQEPWLDKPPLSLWGIAMGLKILGHNEWGARAFHGLCFLLTAGLVFSLGKMIGGMRMGLLGAALFATMILPFVSGNAATPDLPLTACTTAAFVCF